jgi:hypothetical protein
MMNERANLALQVIDTTMSVQMLNIPLYRVDAAVNLHYHFLLCL